MSMTRGMDVLVSREGCCRRSLYVALHPFSRQLRPLTRSLFWGECSLTSRSYSANLQAPWQEAVDMNKPITEAFSMESSVQKGDRKLDFCVRTWQIWGSIPYYFVDGYLFANQQRAVMQTVAPGWRLVSMLQCETDRIRQERFRV